MPRGNRKKEILDVVEQMMKSRRFHEITLDEIAQAAKIGKGTLYRYFKNKDDLFFQLATNGHDELTEVISQSADQASKIPFADLLREMFTRIDSFFSGRHDLMRVMGEHEERFHSFKMHNKEAFSKHQNKMKTAVSKILIVGIERGDIRNDISIQILVHVMMHILRSRENHFNHSPEDIPSIDLLVDIFTNGVGRLGTGANANLQEQS